MYKENSCFLFVALDDLRQAIRKDSDLANQEEVKEILATLEAVWNQMGEADKLLSCVIHELEGSSE